jgi:nicotinamide riboside kinase
MKIALTGTHGVGKTTLAKMLVERLNLPYIHEGARSVIEMLNTYSLDYRDFGDEQRSLFQKCVVNLQLIVENSFEQGFVSDRSLFDCQAYSNFDIEVANIADRYDLIVYLPIEFELEKDGVRFTDPVFQKEIDTKILKSIENIDPNKLIKVTGNVRERLEQVFTKIT